MEDRSIAGSTNGKEMMHYPRNEHGRPAHSYLGFLLITATPDICISPERFSLFVRVRTRLRRRLRTMRDRDVDKPREKIASSEHRVASFSSRIWFAPPPDPGATVRSRNLQFHLFFPPRSISFKTPPRRRNVYQLVLAPPIFLLSLSLSSFFRPPSVSLPPLSRPGSQATLDPAELITAPSHTKLRSQFQLTRNVYVYRTSRVAREFHFPRGREKMEKTTGEGRENENIHARENLIDFDSTG